MSLPPRARLTLRHPPMDGRRDLENSGFPTLFAHGHPSPLCYHVSSVWEIRLQRCNSILTIFAPYTFSHSQGQLLPLPRRNKLNECMSALWGYCSLSQAIENKFGAWVRHGF